MTRLQSTLMAPTSIPNFPAWRISFNTSELRTRTFLGLHPLSEHRPPMLPRSIRATRCPAAAMREVAPRPALPRPMATKSYFIRALRSDDSQLWLRPIGRGKLLESLQALRIADCLLPLPLRLALKIMARRLAGRCHCEPFVLARIFQRIAQRVQEYTDEQVMFHFSLLESIPRAEWDSTDAANVPRKISLNLDAVLSHRRSPGIALVCQAQPTSKLRRCLRPTRARSRRSPAPQPCRQCQSWDSPARCSVTGRSTAWKRRGSAW